MIKVIKNDEQGLVIQRSDGATFFIKENQDDLNISAEPSTIICWKGKQYNSALNLEDVVLSFRSGQAISKFYELDLK